MADNPQLVRPENQLLNPNRQTLNIAQPAESQTQGPSFDFSTVPLVGGGSASDPNNPSIGLGDVARAAVAAPIDMVNDVAEIPKAINQVANTYADNQAKNGAYQALGLSDNAQDTINKIRGTVTQGVNATAGTVGNIAQSASDAIKSGYSEGAKQAAAMPFVQKDAQGDYKLGAGVFDKDAWLMNAVPMATQLLTGGAIAKLGAIGARKAVEDAVFNRLSTTLPEQEARDLARQTADQAAQRAGKAAFVGTMTATTQGQAGLDMHAQVSALPFDQLMASPTFQNAFNNIDNDPANANLTDSQKLELARNQVADQSAAAVTTDPKLLAANIAAAALGDQPLLSLLTRKGAATGIASGIATGVLAGGLSGVGQGAVQQYTQNQQMADATGQPINPMQDVVEAGLNQGAMGAGIGGVAGVVGGIRGRNTQPPEATPEPGATPADNGAATADNTATPGTQPSQPQVSPYDAARQQLSTMGRDDVLRQYASADLTGNADVKAAANDRLAEIDRADKVTQAADKFSQQPESDLLSTYRDLSEKANRSDEDEIQLEAARSVLTNKLGIQPAQTQAAATPAASAPVETSAQPTQPVQPPIESANGVPNSQVDNFRDIPAYARQDPRVQGFADNSEVQQALGRPGAPAPEQLVQQQMQGGNQGYTPEEQRILDQAEQIQADRARREAAMQQAATPRLPAPGDINPGRGYPMPGPVMQDEGQAGPRPQFNAGEQIRGKPPSSDEKPQAQGNEENSRSDETEPVGTSAEPAGGQVETAINDEPVGELKLFAKDQPYSNERVASASKWAKLPGATVENVGDGYGVRLPPEKTNPAGENAQPNAAESSPQGELKLMAQNQPFSTERVAKASKWGKTPGAVVEKVGDGYGVRMPAARARSGSTSKPIEDFGEKIPDAAKDRWGQFSRAMETTSTPDDFAAQSFSKVFPHPEYEQMANAGVDKKALATVAVLRSKIPSKPVRPDRVKRWAQGANEVKDLAAKVLNGTIDQGELRQRMNQHPALRDSARTIDLISRLEPSQMKAASNYRVRENTYSVYDSKEYPNGLKLYELADPKGRTVRGVSDGDYEVFLNKAKGFIDQETGQGSAAKQTKLEIYRDRYTKDVFIGYKGASGVAHIQTGFPDAATARAYLRDNRDALEQKIAALRASSKEEQRRATNQPRTGEPRREGAVTPEKFSDDFGFRGVQFGNYVEGERRQTNLDQAYDSLSDLSDVLNIPKKAVSLNGDLGLAFGARGRGGNNAAAAHYEPGNVVINLTKNQGAGSLAHEWFHALDNYFGRADQGGGKGNFLTESNRDVARFQNGRLEKAVYPVRQEVYDAFKGVMAAIKKSGMRVRASKLDELRSKPYWNTDVELAARAFERYVLDRAESKGISNDFLVNLRKSEDHGSPETYAYPTSEELDGGVRQAFDKLFSTLKTRETDRGTALYSRQSDRPDGGLSVEQAQKIADNFKREYNGNIPLDIQVFPRQEDAYGPQATREKIGRVPGAYHGAAEGRVILNAASILHEADGRRTLQHEILGHYGLNTFKPADKALVLESILKTKDDPNFRKIWQEVEKNYSDKPEMYQAEEAFALAAEMDRSDRNARAGKRFIPASILHAFQMALRRAGLVKGPMKIGELYDAVDAVADGIRNGRRTQQTFPATDQDQFRREENASDSGGVPANGTDIGGGNVITNDSFTPSEENPVRGMRQPEAQYVADQWVRGMNGAAKIKVKVVQTQAEAADMMPNGIPKEYGRVNAIYQPELSRVVVVADNIANSKDLRAKLRHEVLAHHGVASVIGDVEYDRIMRVLDQTRDSKNATIREAWDQVKKSYGDESPEVQANEFLAHMAESSELTGLGGAWDRVVSLITNALRKAGILKPGDISPAEIRNILRTIAGRFRHTKMYDGEQPGTREFDDTFSRTDALYSRAATMKEETDRKMGFTLDQGKIARAKSFYDEMRGKSKDEFKSWLTETGRKLNTKTFDGLAPLKYAEDAAGKSDHPSSAYIGARMAAGSGSVTAATLEHGLPQYNKAEGIIERKAGTGKEDALMGILDSLGSKREDFFKWIAGNRSEQLMKEGREKNFTPQEIAYMKSLRTGNEALFDATKKKYDAFTKSILDLQQDMGLIDPASRAQWENAWYLPYYREAEDGEVTGPWTTRGIANQSSTVRKLKGSEKTIKDPIENLFNYIAKSVDASMKNEAMRRAVVNLADTGVLEVIDNPNKIDYQRIGKDVVKVYMDGKENLVQVNDPDLYRSFTMINMERNKGTFWTAARAAKKVLTISTTAMPDFIIRNFLRDSIHSWAINKDGFRPVVDSWNGLKKALKTDPALVDMMFAGSTFGGGYSNVYDPASTATNIRRILRSKGYTDSQMNEFESSIVRSGKEIMAKVTAGLEKYKHVSEASENANRIATYEAAIRSGKSKAQAAYEARDLMDFGMMGASKIMMDLSDMLPFFNARMQGLGKLGRAIKADPIETLKRGGIIAGASVALMAFNWGNKRYDELPDWDKDNYWHAWIGGQHIRFPKPFEIGMMFGTLPERFVRTAFGKDTPAKFGKLFVQNFANVMSFNLIPQVALPIAEAFFNYDTFTGNPIENMSDANLIAGARYNDQTSLIAREIGEKLNISPKMLDHIVNGYTGTLGAYVLGATNIMMRNLGDYGASPALRLDEMPVIKSFFRDDPAKNTQFIEDFYRMMTTANQVYTTINDYRKQGRQADAAQLQQENRGELSQRSALTATQLQVRGLNQAIEMVLRDKILTSDEKRDRIDKLMARRNEIVQQTVQRVNPYFN